MGDNHGMDPREIVDRALRLHARGWTDRAVAQACGVSVHTVRHWRSGRRRGPEVEARRAARTSYCPRCSSAELDAAAYAYLLGLYLGDGHITAHRRGVHFLAVFCDNAYPGLIRACGEAMEAVFPVSAFSVPRRGCTEVKSASTHWPCLFPQHGPGRKHSRTISLDRWQQEVVDARTREFVRGLFHSDGCRVTNRVRRTVGGTWKYYEYPRSLFSNTSEGILDLLGTALDRLGVRWSLRFRDNGPHRRSGILSVAERTSAALLDSFVGDKR